MLSSLIVLACVFAYACSAVIPSEWQEKIDRYNAFFAEDDTGKLNTEGYPYNMYLVRDLQLYFSIWVLIYSNVNSL